MSQLTPSQGASASVPQPPKPITAGMPDPETIQKHKETYTKMLEQQLSQGIAVLEAQAKHQRDYLSAQAEQQKKQFEMQISMEVQQQQMALKKQHAEQTMALNQQAAQQKAALEQQAMQLTMDYGQKKAEEDMMQQQYDMEKSQTEIQQKMSEDMEKLGVQMPPMPVLSRTIPWVSLDRTIGQQATYVYGPNGELVPKETSPTARAQDASPSNDHAQQ